LVPTVVTLPFWLFQSALRGGKVSGLDVGNRFRLDVASKGCFDDVSQGTPLMTGEPPQFLLNLIAHLNNHAPIIRRRINLGNRGLPGLIPTPDHATA